MLKSYAAIYKQGRLEWLDDAPEQEGIQVIVTFVDTLPQKSPAHVMSILADAWGSVQPPKTVAQIDDDIAQMRNEWD